MYLQRTAAIETDFIQAQYLLDAFICIFFLLRGLRNGMYDIFARLQFSTSPNLQVTELREDMPVIGKAEVQERGCHIICSSWGHIITSAPGHSSTEGQSTPVFSCQFLERASHCPLASDFYLKSCCLCPQR